MIEILKITKNGKIKEFKNYDRKMCKKNKLKKNNPFHFPQNGPAK